MVSLEQRLMDFIRIPTIAVPSDFSDMRKRTGWEKSQQETFDMAHLFLKNWVESFCEQVESQPVNVHEFTGHNIWGMVKGKRNDKAIMLQGHYDVVDAAGSFSPKMNERRLYGRGTTDMKGGLVAALGTFEQLSNRNVKPSFDTYVLFTCEEEVEALGAQTFASHPPDWVNKVALALCMESAYKNGSIELAVTHPGIAKVSIHDTLVEINPKENFWQIRIDVGEHYKHASREPLTIDPNAVMFSILSELTDCCAAEMYSDRPINGSVNTTPRFSECIVSTTLSFSELEQLCNARLHLFLSQIIETDRISTLKSDIQVTIRAAASQRCFNAAQFVNSIIGFRTNAKENYTNALYKKPPFTVSIARMENGQAHVKIDIRTDGGLSRNLSSIVSKYFPSPMDTSINYNDPWLDDALTKDNPLAQQLMEICQKHTSSSITAHSGWTEAAFWSTRLNIPTIVFGPGSVGQDHTANESIDLNDFEQTISILKEFLCSVTRIVP